MAEVNKRIQVEEDTSDGKRGRKGKGLVSRPKSSLKYLDQAAWSQFVEQHQQHHHFVLDPCVRVEIYILLVRRNILALLPTGFTGTHRRVERHGGR